MAKPVPMMRKALLTLVSLAMVMAVLPSEAATIKTVRGTYVTAMGLRPVHSPYPSQAVRDALAPVVDPFPSPVGVGGYNFAIPTAANKQYILKSIQVVDAAATGAVGVLVFFTEDEVQDGACTNAKGFVSLSQEITGRLQPGDNLRVNVLPYDPGGVWVGAEDECTGFGTTGEIIVKYEIRNK